jgi:hypothetical protein
LCGGDTERDLMLNERANIGESSCIQTSTSVEMNSADGIIFLLMGL